MFHWQKLCKHGQSGAMQLATAVALTPLLFFLLRTPAYRPPVAI